MMRDSPDQERNDREFCWEQIHRTNPSFRLSHSFAPREKSEGLVALYALFSIMELLCAEHADPEPAYRKWNWWRRELLDREPDQSRHPVVRELLRTGVLETVAGAELAPLLLQAEQRLDPVAPADITQLRALVKLIYQPAGKLENLYLSGTCNDWEGAFAQAGLFQLLRESTLPGSHAGFWWLPLNLLAKHGLRRDELLAKNKRDAAAALFSELFEACLDWDDADQLQAAGGSDAAVARHWQITLRLMRRKMQRLRGMSPDRFQSEIFKMGMGELLLAWRTARKAMQTPV